MLRPPCPMIVGWCVLLQHPINFIAAFIARDLLVWWDDWHLDAGCHFGEASNLDFGHVLCVY